MLTAASAHIVSPGLWRCALEVGELFAEAEEEYGLLSLIVSAGGYGLVTLVFAGGFTLPLGALMGLLFHRWGRGEAEKDT